ncbi:MAG TPA: protein kinase [Holophaga sp.]|nr:protein kinase [Holophaga sp.]
MNSSVPRMIGGVRVRERIGEGGMAVVHRAEDPFRPDKLLAVKFLRPEAGADPELVRRFLLEGEILKRLRHPHLVEVMGFGKSGTTPFLLMELLPGGSIKNCRGEAPASVIRRLVPVTEALFVAHSAGVIHRDLKPSNLLFAIDGRLKVTDFGVCLWEGGEGTRHTQSRMVVGTIGYMAPEQHGDPRRVDARCDVYAMGAILYEFTTGQPYSLVQLPPANVRPGFPPSLAGILMRSLAPDPSKRVPNMDVLGQELSNWLESAAAAGWGEDPLPGFSAEELSQPTVSRLRSVDENDGPKERLGPYLDALRSGDVGARRGAAERLQASVGAGDEEYLLQQLALCPEGARFALVQALGTIGGETSLSALAGYLSDPFSRAEAADALSRIACRIGETPRTTEILREEGLGSPWRWTPRARLGDEAWLQSLEQTWDALSMPLRLQTLGAARHLPEAMRARLCRATEASVLAGGSLRQAWEALRS